MRAFAALYPDPEALDQINAIIRDIMTAPAPVRWEAPEKIHITLKFLEEIGTDAMDKAIDMLRGDVSKVAPFSLPITMMSAFPTLHRPRIVWLGSKNPPDILGSLQKRIERAFTECGIPPERKKFTPHFTIGRVNQYGNASDLVHAMEACSFPPFEVRFTEVRFMESKLTPQGAIHRMYNNIIFEQ